jgi:hypothetical protein
MDCVANLSAAELYTAIFEGTKWYRRAQACFEHVDIVAVRALSRGAVPLAKDFFGPIDIGNCLVEHIRAA